MNLPPSDAFQPEEQTPARPEAPRRRLRRHYLPETDNERSLLMEELAQRLSPSFDTFLFSLVCGVVLLLALLFDAPGLYVLAALFVPFLGPVIGVALSAIIGSPRLFIQSLGATLLGGLIVFVSGAAAGWLASFWPGLEFRYASSHALFTIPDLFVLALGAGLSVFMLVRAPRQKPLIPNVALGYELFLPLGVAGFGLVTGLPGLWPNGLLLFAGHFLLAGLVAVLVLAAMRLRPINTLGYSFSTGLVIVGIAALVLMAGFGRSAATSQAAGILSLPSRTPTASITPSPTLFLSPTPVTPSPSATRSLVPTKTPTKTVTPKPTPVWARVWVDQGGGAFIREEASSNSKIIGSVLNGGAVQVISDPVKASGTTWVKVITEEGVEGWIVKILLQTATPAPEW